jgi:hypothetical protein
VAYLYRAPQSVQSITRRRTRVETPRVYRLKLAPISFLYPYSDGQMAWSGDELLLNDGIYTDDSARYLAVECERGTSITEAEALVRLGAVEALMSLGLGDAAISLTLGDLVNARYQWLRYRDGR